MSSEPTSSEGTADMTQHPGFKWDQHHEMIEIAAYFKAEHRGFVPGHELDDWLEAEKEVEESFMAMPNY